MAGRQADRQAGRQADRQAGRQTDRRTDRQIDRQARRRAGRQADGGRGAGAKQIQNDLGPQTLVVSDAFQTLPDSSGFRQAQVRFPGHRFQLHPPALKRF